ncbi:MAG: DUF4276 family protein, partial [Chloroflexota bacterium]|nr:DUF4276 family protein [Chloroflexota bacterium]
ASSALLTPRIACIVEGFGEVEAVPVLIRRIGESLNPPVYPHALRPIRHPKSALVHKANVLEKAVELAAESVVGEGGVFIIVDSDEDYPVQLGRQLYERANRTRGDVPITVVVAKWECEAWFLAAAASLQGKRGLAMDLRPPAKPENVQDAKGDAGMTQMAMATRPVAHTFALTPRGPYSFVASREFLEGFAPAAYQGAGNPDNRDHLHLAFVADGGEDIAGVCLRGEGGWVVGEVFGAADPAAVAAQVARILSLDVDGSLQIVGAMGRVPRTAAEWRTTLCSSLDARATCGSRSSGTPTSPFLGGCVSP